MEIKDAVQNAIGFAESSLGPSRTTDIRLEEIESSDLNGKPVWIITLSSISRPNFVSHVIGADPEREYKTFTVAKDSGEVLAMKIRLLALPAV